MASSSVLDVGQAVTLYAVAPALRVIHSDVELHRPPQRSAFRVRLWERPADVDQDVLARVLVGLRRL